MIAQPIRQGFDSKTAVFQQVEKRSQVRDKFGLQNDDLRILRLFIKKVRECDLAKGALCGFWCTPFDVADELGICPRQLRRIEGRL